MLAQVHSFVLQGIEPAACEVEIDVSDEGLPKTTIVGLPDAAVKEAIERVRSAIVNSGFPFPLARLLVNLAPADVRKEGPIYDLPIAVGLLLAGQAIDTQRHRRLMFAGELALDGRIRPVNGVINAAMLARRLGLDGIVLPTANADEAAAVAEVDVYPADTLASVVGFLNERTEIEPYPPLDVDAVIQGQHPMVDFGDVKGQESAKRALAVAAAGRHNVLMIGPAGTGKTLMAKALPGILPPLSRDEAIDVTRIWSTVGLIPPGEPLVTRRPVRTPHHTASPAAIIGGGTTPRPGEVSLAHHGVLFLDEMPEFARPVLETLRQPMEDGEVTIARAHAATRFPARFMLVAAMNPSQAGDGALRGGGTAVEQYMSRISGPIVDRIDIHVEVPAVPYRELTGARRGSDTARLRERVLAAWDRQRRRNPGGVSNALLRARELDELARPDPPGAELLRQAMTELGLSARAYDKVRRVARTIADLAGAEGVAAEHLAEAIQYRLLDREG